MGAMGGMEKNMPYRSVSIEDRITRVESQLNVLEAKETARQEMPSEDILLERTRCLSHVEALLDYCLKKGDTGLVRCLRRVQKDIVSGTLETCLWI